MSDTAPKPDDSQLRRLLTGELPADEEATVLALVEHEPAWQAALDAQAADDATWRAAAASLREPRMEFDSALKLAMDKVDQSPREQSAVHTPTGLETVESGGRGASEPVDLSFLAKSDDPQYLGRLGAYLVESVIGRGGFGVVLKARDPKLARIVAVKVLAPHLAASGTACQRFLREARGAAAVVHEHVITIHAVEDQPLPHLVMQYVAGQSLQDKLDKGGPLDLQAILRIGMQTAAGLAAAHKQGLVHRDIKPANILLENGVERVKITDFGLARAADDASLTRSGVVAGTPQYMSPEQARGAAVDARSDLFSLGSVLYAMCAGRAPFRADSTLAVLKRVCEDQARPIREINPAVPAWLASIIDRLMAKDPARRFASAQEVADLLGKCLLHVQQPQANPLPAELTAMAVVAEVIAAPLPPVRPAQLRPEDVVPPIAAPPSGDPVMLAAKPVKYPVDDPLAHAPDAVPASPARRGLLGCLLIVGGLLLASCVGVVWTSWSYSTPTRGSAFLIVEIPDNRLSADLRLERLDQGYVAGEALQSLHTDVEIAPDSRYRLAPGDYRLRVKSDEVVVHTELIHLSDRDLRTVKVPEAGLLYIDFQPSYDTLQVTINGQVCINSTNQPSKRVLVIPAGTLRIKTMWGGHIYAERLIELKAKEQKSLKLTAHNIEEVADVAAPQ